MLALHHEPENDAGPPGMTPAAWLRMQRHAITMASTLAPNVTIVPILMRWTFDPGSGRDPSEWICSEAAIFGVDVYNDWSPTEGHWTSMPDLMADVLP